MPNEQQEWLRETYETWLEDPRIGSLYEYLASAWPSSPQGLAVEQVMDIAEHYILGTRRLHELSEAVEAAREAGL